MATFHEGHSPTDIYHELSIREPDDLVLVFADLGTDKIDVSLGSVFGWRSPSAYQLPDGVVLDRSSGESRDIISEEFKGRTDSVLHAFELLEITV